MSDGKLRVYSTSVVDPHEGFESGHLMIEVPNDGDEKIEYRLSVSSEGRLKISSPNGGPLMVYPIVSNVIEIDREAF